MTWYTEPVHTKKEAEKHVPGWPELEHETWICNPTVQLLVNIGEMLSREGLYDNSNQRSLHAVLFGSLVCIVKLQQSTRNALRFAIWDCVLKWKAIQQAIQISTGLQSGQTCWGCGTTKTFATAAFWWTWTPKPKQTIFGGKTAVYTRTPLFYATCGGYAVWKGLLSLPRHRVTKDMTPTCAARHFHKRIWRENEIHSLLNESFHQVMACNCMLLQICYSRTHHCTAQACSVLCHSVSWQGVPYADLSKKHGTQKFATCILALPHWEMACQAEPAPSEMKLRGKLQPWSRLEPKTWE